MRCTAALDIDGRLFGNVIKDGMPKPFMFLISRDSWRAKVDLSKNSEIRDIMTAMQSLYDRLPHDTRQWLFLQGANHFLYNDDGAVLTNTLIKRLLGMLGVLQIEGRQIVLRW